MNIVLFFFFGYFVLKMVNKNHINESQGDKQNMEKIGATMENIGVSPKKGEKANYDLIYRKWGDVYHVDPVLIKSIAIKESGENPSAINPNDPSFGLMQILYRIGSDGQVNKFNVNGWPPLYQTQLFDPDYNVKIGTQILAWNIKTYGKEKGIAVYNNWSARETEKGKPFPNQNYVDDVLKIYASVEANFNSVFV